MAKNERLPARWTMQQYERLYRQALYDTVKAANPNWQTGQPFEEGLLDNVTRENVEKYLKDTLLHSKKRSVRNHSLHFIYATDESNFKEVV